MTLLPAFFFAVPRKAEATVPVNDSSVLSEAVSTVSTLGDIYSTLSSVYNTASDILSSITSLETKEYILDPIVNALAKQLLHSLTQSVVNWIKSGFEGSPLFITDFDKYLADAADQATGRFFKEFLSPEMQQAICSPFRAQLYLGLKTTSTFQQRMTCTLSSVIKNASDFSNSLRGGNWSQWLSISLNPSNDPNMALLTSLDELSRRKAQAENKAQTESIFNGGLLSVKNCTEYWPLDPFEVDQGAKPKCKTWKTTSPGKLIESELSHATGADFQELALADEIDEIISALISELLSWALSGGTDDSGMSGYNPSPVSSNFSNQQKLNNLQALLDASIQEENDYKLEMQNAIKTLQNASSTYISAKTCYQTSTTSAEVGATANIQIARINQKLNDIEKTTIPAINKKIDGVAPIIAKLTDIQARLPGVDSATFNQDITDINKEYTALKTQLHKLTTAQSETEKAKTKLEDAQTALNACKGT